MKLYILMQIFQHNKSKRPYEKVFVDYQVAVDCGLKLQKEFNDRFYHTMQFEIYDVELDI